MRLEKNVVTYKRRTIFVFFSFAVIMACCSSYQIVHPMRKQKCLDSNSLAKIHEIEQAMALKFDVSVILSKVFQDDGLNNGTWLQIGANTLDPIKNKNDPLINMLQKVPSWSKYFVEPIPILFEQLKENIKRWPNTLAINAAIGVNPATAHQVEYMSMFCLKQAVKSKEFLTKDFHDEWANQICSFSSDHIKKHFPNGETTTFNVTTLSPSLLMHKYKISEVDVLMIDAEGFDFKILQNFPITKMRPKVIIYESFHLQDELTSAELFMRSHCYALHQYGENVVGVAVEI